jgi:NitT/TauT family transport system substrate-binding protein
VTPLVSHYLKEMPEGLFSLYFAATTRDWASKNPAAIKAFRAALEEGNAYLVAEPAKSRDILAQAMKLPPDAVASIVIPTLKVPVPQSDLTYWINTLVDQGVTKTHPDPARLIVN